MAYHVTKAQFAKLVERALAELPDPFAQYLEEVAIEIRDRPSRRQLAGLGLKDDELLLGLYHGRPRTERSVLDGPAMPWSPTDRKLLDLTDGLVPILPVHQDINDSMEDIIAALGGTERKLVGVVLSEVNPTAVSPQRDKQYA